MCLLGKEGTFFLIQNIMKELFKFGGFPSKKEMTVAGIIGGICVLFLWYLVAITGVVSNKILPNPIDMLCSIPDLFTHHNLVGNIGYTVSLNLLGYVIALAIAIPLGFIIGIYPVPRAMFQKPLEGLRFLALPATTGLFVASLGLGFEMKATFLAVGILIYILPAVAQRVTDLQNPQNVKDNVYLQTAVTIGMSNWDMFRYVYWPYVMERVYCDVRNLVAVSYTYVTIAENINRDGGVGALIGVFARQSRIPEVYALLFVIVIIGIIQDSLFRVMDPILFKHHKE